MKYLIITQALAALLFVPAALATASTLSACTTKLGTKSTSKVATTTYALTITLVATTKSTQTPVVTRTPPPTTATVSSTKIVNATTTLPPVTGTITQSFSFFETSTQTVTATVTETTTTDVTTTAAQSTTTIQPAPGFTPAASVVPPGQAGTARKRDVLPGRRGRIEARAAGQKILCKGGKPSPSPALYPSAVTCGVLVRTTTTKTLLSTAAPTTITLPPSVVTSTVPVTQTNTLTVIPAAATVTQVASTTITLTSTTTVTTTTTQTATNTATEVPPAATFYAACASNNLLVRVNGNPITAISAAPGSGFDFTDANSPYACCVACLNTNGCGASAYLDPSQCYFITNPTCSASTVVASFATSPAGSDGFIVSNSGCGQYRYEGDAEY